MSKLLSLFSRSGNSNTDAIRQSTTMTMAYLLEQNRKFEFFMREKVERLEQLVSSQQQTRADFDEAYEDDFIETEIGDEETDDRSDESDLSPRKPITALVEDELLTDPTPSVELPEPLTNLEITSSSAMDEEETEDGEDDLSMFGMSADKATSPSAAGEEDLSDPPSWEFFLGENPNESREGASAGDHEEDGAVPNEHLQALTELGNGPNLSWMVEGMVHAPVIGDVEMAATYTPDMVEEIGGAIELGMVGVEDLEVVEEDEMENEIVEATEAPGAEEFVPNVVEENETSEQDEGSGDQKILAPAAPVNNKPPAVVRNLEATRPIRLGIQPVDDDEEEVEALIPAWLKEKL
ncbi:MAG: hypothetical protein KJ077_25820 [Anaerolineae bacterium]|nr:hypothetical protein [Anaerolineae bacterium]